VFLYTSVSVGKLRCFQLNEDIRFYKGKFKVKVTNQSKGYWTIEALEDFEDLENDACAKVKKGESRIVPSNTVLKSQKIPPPIKEHSYELRMEKKVKKMVEEEEKK
jgi:hypothetical protein